jgi:hypothetical protein
MKPEALQFDASPNMYLVCDSLVLGFLIFLHVCVLLRGIQWPGKGKGIDQKKQVALGLTWAELGLDGPTKCKEAPSAGRISTKTEMFPVPSGTLGCMEPGLPPLPLCSNLKLQCLSWPGFITWLPKICLSSPRSHFS